MEPSVNYFRRTTPELPIYVTYRVTSGQDNGNMGFTYVSRFFSVLLVFRGRVQTSIQGVPVVLQPGDMRIFLQGDLHHFRCIDRDTRYLQISLTENLLDLPKTQYIYQRFVKPLVEGTLDCPRLLHPGDEGYQALYRQMNRLDQTKEGQDLYNATIYSVAINLCTELLPYCTTGQRVSYHNEDAVRICLKYMNDHSAERITLEQLAQQVHLHPNYLCTVFKTYTGKTIFEHLTVQRLRRSARELCNSALTIQQIAEKNGFPSVSFYSRKFRAIYHCTPGQYRKKYGHSYPELDEEE